MRILWADDQIDVAKTLAAEALPADWKIQFVDSGVAAWESLGDVQYDLLILDLSMPPGPWGGLWLLEQMKSRPDIVTASIVVSGEGTQHETIKALRLGATDYVVKEKVALELLPRIKEASKAHEDALLDALKYGETETAEFKSTLRTNLHTGKADANMELACLKSLAGFLNGNGGTLYIGVRDDGSVLGLDADNFASVDRFQLHFWNLFRERIGSEFVEFVRTKVIQSGSGIFFAATCRRSTKPVYVEWKAPGDGKLVDHFFVRAGPRTELLGTRQAVEYIKTHFGRI